MNDEVRNFYGNQLRVRACGLCMENNSLLLINHRGLYGHDFWAPPGGGIAFGEAATDALKREFFEETGLTISVHDFAFCCEVIKPPLHALELFFRVNRVDGDLRKGHDPETVAQIIEEVRFLSWSEIEALPPEHRHGILRKGGNFEEISSQTGFFKI